MKKQGSIFTIIIKILIILGVMGYLVYAVIAVCHSTGDLVCEGVNIEMQDTSSTRLIDEEYIQTLLLTQKILPKGQAYKDIDMALIDSIVMSDPYVDTLTTTHSSSGILTIKVKPRIPILHIMSSTGAEFYLDQNGNALPFGDKVADLCIVTGNVTPEYARENLTELGRILTTDEYWKLQAQQLHITPSGKIELITRVGEHTIVLGSAENLTDKLQRVRTFYEKGLPAAAGWQKYKTINVEYNEQIVCTKK